MSGTLVVLIPSGHRQTVKVSPNTTILQVIEEVCAKQGLQPERYNLKHHRKLLDVSLTIRFSGLPNNCQVELAEAERARVEHPVTVGVQTEDGKRVMDEFKISQTVYDVLKKLCPMEIQINTVVIYMRNEIYGDELKNKTLKSLGITSGRAMLRLIHRSPDELKQQANVSAPLPTKPVIEKPYKRQFQPIESTEMNIPKETKPHNAVKQEEAMQVENTADEHLNKPPPPAKSMKNDSMMDKIKQEKRKQTEGLKIKSQPAQSRTQSEPPKSERKKEDFVFLGARNAMLFSYETAQMLSNENLPDDFFELSITDVKKLFRDIKRNRLEMESAPLLTSAMRELEENKKQLRALNQYKRAVIRVQFPNRMVLQGVFKPSETIKHVCEFVTEYLEDKALPFYLFSTPPKCVLENKLNLLEAECVPGALLHFGCDVKRENYLRSDILDKVVSNSSAATAASHFRLENMRTRTKSQEDEEDIDIAAYLESQKDGGSSTSEAQTDSTPMDYEKPSRKVTDTPEKVPKWFKTAK